jgi:Holliday junction resolvasome RuvABC endonuclease subunit
MCPCKLFAIIQVFRLQLNKPIRLSVRLGHNCCPSGVKILDAGFINLPVHLGQEEGVRNGVGGNGHADSNKCSMEVSSVLILAKLASSKLSIPDH